MAKKNPKASDTPAAPPKVVGGTSEQDRADEAKASDIFKTWPRTQIVFGPGVLKDAGKYTSKYGKKALIVIGGGSVKRAGFLNILLTALDASGVEAKIFEGVEENPSQETIIAIARTFTQDHFEVMIALGGGSAMDAAKAALILTGTGEKDLQSFFGVGEVSKRIPRISPCICIPTTAGTSSEVTRYSNITIKALGLKKLISDIAIHPHLALVDPELSKSCPKDLTVTAGLDTLTHLMEGYLNTMQDPGNDDINQRALLGIGLVFRWLQIAAEQPQNTAARRMMCLASVLGGTVIGGERFKGTGGPHMNSFSWAETIAHGKSTGIMLPYYIIYYAKVQAVVDKLKPIGQMLGITEGSHPDKSLGKAVALAMLKWYGAMGFPAKLKDIPGWKEPYYSKALKDAGQNAMKLKAMPNPVPLEKVDEIIGPIIKAALDGNIDLIP